jgi:voltage-gated potassium channel Kch
MSLVSTKSTINHKRVIRLKKFRQVLMALILMALALGLLIVPVEMSAANSEIKNPFDGVYWAVTTLTTVGYGDIVPVTYLGKIISILLQLVGAMMFGISIALFSMYLNRSQDEFYWNRLFDRLNRLEEQVIDLKKRSDYLVKKEE